MVVSKKPEVRCPSCKNKVLTRPNQTSATCRCGTRFNTTTGRAISPTPSTDNPSKEDSRSPSSSQHPQVRCPSCKNKVLTRPNQTSATCHCGTRFNTTTGRVISPAPSTVNPPRGSSNIPKNDPGKITDVGSESDRISAGGLDLNCSAWSSEFLGNLHRRREEITSQVHLCWGGSLQAKPAAAHGEGQFIIWNAEYFFEPLNDIPETQAELNVVEYLKYVRRLPSGANIRAQAVLTSVKTKMTGFVPVIELYAKQHTEPQIGPLRLLATAPIFRTTTPQDESFIVEGLEGAQRLIQKQKKIILNGGSFRVLIEAKEALR